MTEGQARRRFGKDSKILWRDRKRPIFGWPLSFTRYAIIEKNDTWLKLFRSKGLLSIEEDEINFYRIFDIKLRRNLFNRIFGVGTITLYTNDETLPEVDILLVKDPVILRDMISERVEQERQRRKVGITEFRAGFNSGGRSR